MVHGLPLDVPTNFVATLFTRIGEKSLEMVQICTIIPNGFMSRDHHGNHDGCHHSTAFGQRRRRLSVQLWVMTR